MRREFVSIDAVVFDAYGTLFDTASAARRHAAHLGERWTSLAQIWRDKQLQYTWLRGLSGQWADFWTVTSEALDFAMGSLNLADPVLRAGLMRTYLTPGAFPDVADALQHLHQSGKRVGILSNGSSTMLDGAVQHAGLGGMLSVVLSVDTVQTFKPHPKVYQLAVDAFELPAHRILFVSSNGWDAWSAKAFGFRVVWCNRSEQTPERLPCPPDQTVQGLASLPSLLL
ncbi:MAG: haloacid dehalogenase type II [Betaproteobacteria bacterium]|nr:haloacid dehalogenase type II [Betaproteobacteria bacterium]MDE2124418.1 haloacid dehalogenase type II [Betaproteobacteria bacterium]MDE2186806.1 haloacid dehalogenase type II [Betaproteobacteria bacterium]MDE2325411.1 haloacid dehalogenase type II [Betaproteobacteria bacterium]